jgi:hypothetical protein
MRSGLFIHSAYQQPTTYRYQSCQSRMNIPWLFFCKEVEDPGVVRTDLADRDINRRPHLDLEWRIFPSFYMTRRPWLPRMFIRLLNLVRKQIGLNPPRAGTGVLIPTSSYFFLSSLFFFILLLYLL